MKTWDELNLAQKIENLNERLLSQACENDLCPNNYSESRVHNWEWHGSALRQNRYLVPPYMTMSAEKLPRLGIYRQCTYCFAEDWAVTELAERVAGLPVFKNGDKAIFHSDDQDWDEKKQAYKNTRTIKDYHGEIREAWLSVDFSTHEVGWRYGILCELENGIKHEFTPMGEDLRLDTATDKGDG